MAATETADSVYDHMTRLRMKMVQQKIANEKDKILQRPPSEESNKDELENQARLQQAMLRRQELLDRIRREQLMNEENKRPRSYSSRRRYTPSPLPIPPSRRSVPDFFRYNYPDTFRARAPDMPQQVKHVIEHTIRPPPDLPPIQQPNQPPRVTYQPPPPVIVAPPPPPPQIMQQQQPQIIQAPPAPHIIAANPSPVITNLNPTSDNRSMFNKADFGDMMTMQNAQLHQLVMQKMMLGDLGPNRYLSSRHLSTRGLPCQTPHHSHHAHHAHHSHHPYHHHQSSHCTCSACVPRGSGAVHHHHYTAPAPQPEPAVHTYTTMPALELRGGYPMRGFASAYTSPAYSTYQYEDGATYPNYYAYH